MFEHRLQDVVSPLPTAPGTASRCVLSEIVDYSFQIDKARNLIRETWKGRVTLERLEQADAELMNHPDFADGMHLLSDVRNAELDLHYSQMEAYVAEIGPKERWGKMAVVVSSVADRGMARMYETLCRFQPNYFQEFRIFESLEEAEKWMEQ